MQILSQNIFNHCVMQVLPYARYVSTWLGWSSLVVEIFVFSLEMGHRNMAGK